MRSLRSYDPYASERTYTHGDTPYCVQCGENEAIWLESLSGETVVAGIEYLGEWWSRCNDCEYPDEAGDA